MGITEFIERLNELIERSRDREKSLIGKYDNPDEYVREWQERKINEKYDEYKDEMMGFIDSRFGGK
ncbi:hypothetical protein MWG61_13350 [Bacillus safensis]|uniref:hypothetical protein n=1 Tax=Bacillus safensis TaxID=561879 RepID=UPI002280D004|nr:hypothetical protein [Bacillus safensis]MCY7525126.1 hypothetical protein [Bacillus safensis]